MVRAHYRSKPPPAARSMPSLVTGTPMRPSTKFKTADGHTFGLDLDADEGSPVYDLMAV